MFNRVRNVQADFFRSCGTAAIVVYLDNKKKWFYLFAGSIDLSSKKLGEKEIVEVIAILSRKKEAMLKQHNFPQVYDELLSELIDVQRERYEVKKDKKRKLGFSVSLSKIEEIIGEYYKIKEVYAYSIDVGSNRSSAEWIDLDSDGCYLVLSFREAEEKEKHE